MKKINLLFCFFLLGFNLYSQETKKVPQQAKQNSTSDKIEIKTYRTDELIPFEGKVEKGWGYDIYKSDAKYIHQPTIPAINGNHSFKTEADAKKVAGLMVKKIRNNISPPTIEIKELDSLGISK